MASLKHRQLHSIAQRTDESEGVPWRAVQNLTISESHFHNPEFPRPAPVPILCVKARRIALLKVPATTLADVEQVLSPVSDLIFLLLLLVPCKQNRMLNNKVVWHLNIRIYTYCWGAAGQTATARAFRTSPDLV